ncbi:EGF domain-specific O-linked N-acetylglucosamine transferase [Mycena sanguinolenta]|uniref:EGF domain-specific O-linked N-acetylglucosamine transferase n=1 Tax=Mycena sanguinolenta TaxID=230812 RepID=A0A8H6ZME4_9AGAR|nr:EGF domain-specific O-linked N-acetylglucosamine transferase [Mycena sanguinolenta]
MAQTRYGLRIVRIILLFTILALVVYYNLKSGVDSIEPPSPIPAPKPPPTQTPLPSDYYGWTLTTIPNGTHVPGFTLLDHLYLRNGTFYVVTLDRASFPFRENLLSRPVETQLRFIAPGWQDAGRILGTASGVLGLETKYMKDFSVIVYDPPELMKDYFHWFGEVILGAWRVYSHISPDEPAMSATPPKHLPLPRHFILPFMGRGDLAGSHGALMRAAFPYVTIEWSDYWDDLKRLDTTVVFDRVMLVNRHAATRSPSGSVPWSSSMIAGAMNVTVPPNFLGSCAEYAVAGHALLEEGFDRRLSAEDHDGLIEALRELHAEGICDVRVVTLERMTLREQIHVAARTSILIGVHGSELNLQLWMPGSTVIEIFAPNGYSFDNELVARNMGLRHYAVWNDTFVTYDKGSYHPTVNFSDGFDGVIPVHGPTVSSIIRSRLPAQPAWKYRTILPGTAWYDWSLT